MFAAFEGKAVRSFAVVRIDGPAYFKVGRIIDFVSFDEAEKFSLLNVVDFCRAQAVHFVDYYFSGTFHGKSLPAAGFVDCSRGAYAFLPKALNPVVTGGKTSINFFVTTNGEKECKKARSLKNWYTTKGGGDQDRAY